MSTLGQKLREEREKRGLSIEQQAEQTRIHAHYFEAIERDDKDSLPGGFFYRSFVRQYARLLELPESAYQHELDTSLQAEIDNAAGRETALPEHKVTVPPMPTGRVDRGLEARRWLTRVGLLLVAVAVCSGAYMLFERWRRQLAEAPQQPAPTHAKPAENKPAQPAAPPAESPAQTATMPDQPSGPVRVILRAHEMTWVGVWRGQQMLYGDLIRAGETRGFGSEDKLRVRLGNAGGVEIEWNGRVIPQVGPRGQVRTVDFWTDGYAPFEPPPPAPKPDAATAPPAQP